MIIFFSKTRTFTELELQKCFEMTTKMFDCFSKKHFPLPLGSNVGRANQIVIGEFFDNLLSMIFNWHVLYHFPTDSKYFYFRNIQTTDPCHELWPQFLSNVFIHSTSSSKLLEVPCLQS